MFTDIIGDEKMNINKNKILELIKGYDDCFIEEIYEDHDVMGNWCVITCDLIEEDGDLFVGGIFDLIDDIEKHNNIKNLFDETVIDENGEFYECVSIEWN